MARADALLLRLVVGTASVDGLEGQVAGIEHLAEIAKDAPPDGAEGRKSQAGFGLALPIALASLGLSLFLYLRRHHFVEQTLRNAGLL